MANTIATSESGHPHKKHRWLRVPQKVHEDHVRRRAGIAYARLQASGDHIARALGKDASTVTHRKAGQGGLANLLLEIDAMERAGVDTTPMLEAILDTQIGARADVPACPFALAIQEQELDNAENAAQTAYLAGKGCLKEWRDSIAAYLAHGMITLRRLPER